MLEGIRANEIIVGAYSDRDGGVCPMLAAHRCGGRTSFISFARAWDAFAGVKRARRATRARAARPRAPPGWPRLGRRARTAARAPTPATPRPRRGDRRPPGGRRASAAPARPPKTGGWGFLKERRERQDAQRALERVERERELLRPASRRPLGGLSTGARAQPAGRGARRRAARTGSPGRRSPGTSSRKRTHSGDVLRADHRLRRDVLLDEVRHRRVDEARAQRGALDAGRARAPCSSPG